MKITFPHPAPTQGREEKWFHHVCGRDPVGCGWQSRSWLHGQRDLGFNSSSQSELAELLLSPWWTGDKNMTCLMVRTRRQGLYQSLALQTLFINSFHPHHKPYEQILSLSSLCRRGNWSRGRLCNLPKVIYSKWTGIQSGESVFLTRTPHCFSLQDTVSLYFPDASDVLLPEQDLSYANWDMKFKYDKPEWKSIKSL